MNWRQDLGSKLFDGILAAVMLYLLYTLALLLVGPIQARTGRPGLLIYCLVLIALSVYCLEHSLLLRIPDTYRAWYGMLGGVAAWSSVRLSHILAPTGTNSISEVLALILVGLTVTRLWRRHLPLGAKFYALTFLTMWAAQFLLDVRQMLIAWQPLFHQGYQIVGYVAVGVGAGIIWWIFFRTDRRLHRLNLAPALAFCILYATAVLITGWS